MEEAVGEVFKEIVEKNPPKEVKVEEVDSYANMFGDIEEDNVVFCIDTSGSMYSCLDVVKVHLIEALHKKVQNKGRFNLIEFNTEVTKWSDSLIQCTPDTVGLASAWIRNLQAKTGTNTLEALLIALADPVCEAVYLVTDGYPDQSPTEILDNVAAVGNNRPVHCHYIQSGAPDNLAVEFLKDLAMESYGSFHITTIERGLVTVTPVYRAQTAAERIIRTVNGNVYPSNYKACSVAATLAAPVSDVVYTAPVSGQWGLPYPRYILHKYI